MAYRIRFVMQMTAREAMHLTELRSQPQGHPTYRRVAQAMHRLIGDVHPAIGAAFTYMSYEDVDLERLEAERRTEVKRNALEAELTHQPWRALRRRVDVRIRSHYRPATSTGSRGPARCRSSVPVAERSINRTESPTATSIAISVPVGTVRCANPVQPVLDRLRGRRRRTP